MHSAVFWDVKALACDVCSCLTWSTFILPVWSFQSASRLAKSSLNEENRIFYSSSRSASTMMEFSCHCAWTIFPRNNFAATLDGRIFIDFVCNEFFSINFIFFWTRVFLFLYFVFIAVRVLIPPVCDAPPKAYKNKCLKIFLLIAFYKFSPLCLFQEFYNQA